MARERRLAMERRPEMRSGRWTRSESPAQMEVRFRKPRRRARSAPASKALETLRGAISRLQLRRSQLRWARVRRLGKSGSSILCARDQAQSVELGRGPRRAACHRSRLSAYLPLAPRRSVVQECCWAGVSRATMSPISIQSGSRDSAYASASSREGNTFDSTAPAEPTTSTSQPWRFATRTNRAIPKS